MFDVLLFYLAVGALAGLLSGLFGIGGGIVVVPLLAWSFPHQGFAEERAMVMAVATSLATIVFTSLSAVRAHHRLGAMRWDWVWWLAPGLVIGTVLGALAGDWLPGRTLKFLYALFLLYVAAHLAFARTETGAHQEGDRWRITGVGLAIGTLSAILGIGGGTLTVSWLARRGLPIRNAAAISSACGLPIALGGTAAYLWLGWERPDLPPFSYGYIYLPALFGIAACSALTAPLGARLAHHLPARWMKRLFVALLALVAAHFFQQSFDPARLTEILGWVRAGFGFVSGGN
jgi:uncharacterized membrane protein YfcA